MKLAIIGSRTCPTLDIEAQLKYIPDTIISGGAKGADTLAREFAQKHNLNLVEYLPEYDKYPPKIAPLKRNELIVDACDCLLAFLDSTSMCTKFTIDLAVKKGKPVKIYNYITNEVTRL